MRRNNALNKQLDRLFSRYPWARWPAIGFLLLLAMIGVRLDRDPPRTTQLPGGQIEGRATVIDGDSLRIAGAEIRLKDIDAPEGRQTCRREGREWNCGEEASRTLTRLIAGRNVVCRSVERDKHDRFLGYCAAEATQLNRAMVEAGMAVAFGGFRSEEQAAKAARRGLWAGEFQTPRDWRHERGIGQ